MIQCTICGAWYCGGQFHMCPLTAAPQQPIQYYTYPLWVDNIALQRIAAALEKLAEIEPAKPEAKLNDRPRSV